MISLSAPVRIALAMLAFSLFSLDVSGLSLEVSVLSDEFGGLCPSTARIFGALLLGASLPVCA